MNPSFPEPAGHTKRFVDFKEADLLPKEIILLAESSSEDRGQLPLWKRMLCTDAQRMISVGENNSEKALIKKGEAPAREVLLRNEEEIKEIISVERLLIDISGLPHHVWAPILKSAYEMKVPTRVMYAEPDKYTLHPTPASETMFDLSVSFDGLAPLPGFLQLTEPADDSKCLFVALLGFEGNRPKRLIYQIEPEPVVIPVVGVPGFKMEFPAYTITCNRSLFSEFHAHANIHFVRASCPFDTYETLTEIKANYPDYYMYLAPVGTKPHSLGAILYAIKHSEETEIMFDHPVRKAGRTEGIGIIHIYDFGCFDEL